jgi:hypothetical protein
VPSRPIGPWSRRTGAPEASATGRDRTPMLTRLLTGRVATPRDERVQDGTTLRHPPSSTAWWSPRAHRPAHRVRNLGSGVRLPRAVPGSCPRGGGHQGRASPLACDLTFGHAGLPSAEVGGWGGELGRSGGLRGRRRLLAGFPGGLLDGRVARGRPGGPALGAARGAPEGFRCIRWRAKRGQKSRKPAAHPWR